MRGCICVQCHGLEYEMTRAIRTRTVRQGRYSQLERPQQNSKNPGIWHLITFKPFPRCLTGIKPQQRPLEVVKGSHNKDEAKHQTEALSSRSICATHKVWKSGPERSCPRKSLYSSRWLYVGSDEMHRGDGFYSLERPS